MPPLQPSAGALLRAAHDLAVADAGTLQRLAGQLGLLLPHAPASGDSQAQAARTASPSPPPPTPLAPPPPSPLPPAEAGQRSATGSAQPGAGVAARLEPLPALSDSAGPGGPPAWRAAGARQMAKGPVDPPTPHDPLFQPASRRALGAALAARRVAEGDIDLEHLHHQLAAGGTPPRRLPRLPLWTLRDGLQLLVDLGPQMQPWQRDIEELRQLLARLLGPGQLQPLGFDGDPLHGCRLPGSATPQRWPPPPPGRPLLVLTDLGIHRATGPAPLLRHWHGLARAAAEAGTPVRVLVPHAPGRWPRGLPASLQLLWWDRRTSVASLRRLLAP